MIANYENEKDFIFQNYKGTWRQKVKKMTKDEEIEEQRVTIEKLRTRLANSERGEQMFINQLNCEIKILKEVITLMVREMKGK